MSKFSRRLALFTTVSVAAVAVAYHAIGGPLTDYFVEAPKKGAVSFKEAQKSLHELLAKEIKLSQKDFGITYSASDVERIRLRVWDRVQYALSEFYLAKEQRSDIDRDNPKPGMPVPSAQGAPAGAGAPGGQAGQGGGGRMKSAPAGGGALER